MRLGSMRSLYSQGLVYGSDFESNMADYAAVYPTFYEALAFFRNREALMQSVLQVSTSTPLYLAAEEEDTWNDSAWDSSSAAEESSEVPEGSSVTAETSYEGAGYYSEASQYHSADNKDLSAETPCEAVTYAPGALVEPLEDISGATEGAEGLTETAEAPLEAAEESSTGCSDGGVVKKASISKIEICSGDNHSSSFGFTLAWAQVTKEVLSGVFNTFRNGRNKKSAETAAEVCTEGTAAVGGAVGPTASSALSVASKGSGSRMATGRLRELPSRIPKPSKGSAGGAVKRGTRPAAETACLPPSLIPKPRSAKTAHPAVEALGTKQAAVGKYGNCSSKASLEAVRGAVCGGEWEGGADWSEQRAAKVQLGKARGGGQWGGRRQHFLHPAGQGVVATGWWVGAWRLDCGVGLNETTEAAHVLSNGSEAGPCDDRGLSWDVAAGGVLLSWSV
ncbi:unnamed protein product [Closterium sp. Yama58-4]|nr:unnamed protein product [Closterium sp. Yama58-4]